MFTLLNNLFSKAEEKKKDITEKYKKVVIKGDINEMDRLEEFHGKEIFMKLSKTDVKQLKKSKEIDDPVFAILDSYDVESEDEDEEDSNLSENEEECDS